MAGVGSDDELGPDSVKSRLSKSRGNGMKCRPVPSKSRWIVCSATELDRRLGRSAGMKMGALWCMPSARSSASRSRRFLLRLRRDLLLQRKSGWPSSSTARLPDDVRESKPLLALAGGA